MYYLLAGAAGFLLSGLWFAAQLWLKTVFLKAGQERLLFLAPLLTACVPAALLFLWIGGFSLRLSALPDGRAWLLTAGTLLCTCLVKCLGGRTAPSPERPPLLRLCAEAALMEVPQRLMMQTFVMHLLALWGCRTCWCIPITALIWCAGILLQALILHQPFSRSMAADLAASFVFSLGAGHVFYQTGCIVFSMAAHAAERFITVKPGR